MSDENSFLKPSVRVPTAAEILNFEQDIRPKLFQLSIMTSDGASESEITDFLGISKDTFYFYKRYFPEMKQAICKGKLSLVEQAERSLQQLSVGGVYEDVEITEFQKKKDDDSGDFEVVSRKVKRTSKVLPPNIKAIETILYSKDPDNWKRQISDNVNQTNNTVIANFNPKDAEALINKLKGFSESTIKHASDEMKNVGDV